MCNNRSQPIQIVQQQKNNQNMLEYNFGEWFCWLFIKTCSFFLSSQHHHHHYCNDKQLADLWGEKYRIVFVPKEMKKKMNFSTRSGERGLGCCCCWCLGILVLHFFSPYTTSLTQMFKSRKTVQTE